MAPTQIVRTTDRLADPLRIEFGLQRNLATPPTKGPSTTGRIPSFKRENPVHDAAKRQRLRPLAPSERSKEDTAALPQWRFLLGPVCQVPTCQCQTMAPFGEIPLPRHSVIRRSSSGMWTGLQRIGPAPIA